MGFGAKQGNTGVAALRAQVGVGAARAKPSSRAQQPDLRPPPPRPPAKDMSDDLAAKAERLSQLQHETSLLKREPRNDRSKDYQEKKKGGLIIQLLLVILLAAGVTVALDPELSSRLMAMVDWEEVKFRLGLN
jgi:hypothetical protein